MDNGASASQTGLVGPSDPSPDGLGHSATIPSAEVDAANAEQFGALYHEIQQGEYACSTIVCMFPHDGNCWCFNEALRRYVAQAMETRRAETEGLGAQHDSAVGNADAPELTRPSQES